MQMKKKTAGVIGVGSFGLVATVVVVQMWRLHAGNVRHQSLSHSLAIFLALSAHLRPIQKLCLHMPHA